MPSRSLADRPRKRQSGWRAALVLCALCNGAPAAQAWEFTPGLPCRLSHSTAGAEIELTYDPRQPLYSVTIRRDVPFDRAAVLAMRFEGPAGLTISTDRHDFSADGRAVTVFDSGFGNLLNGLQFNDMATAILGAQTVSFPLTGAEEKVAAFRACRAEPGV